MNKLAICLLALVLSANGDDLISPIPLQAKVDARKAELGKRLFFETRLSKDDSISCASCHDLDSGGADSGEVSFGVDGKSGDMNSPTVFNAAYNIAQFWDGRAQDLKEQAKGPITNPVEMASDEAQVVEKLSADAAYVKSFQEIYAGKITLDNVSDAIAEFEKTLITPNSKFDLFIKGENVEFAQDEKDGYSLFKNLGCVSCHNGINIGSNMFQKFGIFADRNDSFNHLGRFNVTKNENDKYYFKVPTLRNIEKTAPYFHDGSAKTLQDAVRTMGLYQLGQELSREEIEKITSFLRTLTGESPKSISK